MSLNILFPLQALTIVSCRYHPQKPSTMEMTVQASHLFNRNTPDQNRLDYPSRVTTTRPSAQINNGNTLSREPEDQPDQPQNSAAAFASELVDHRESGFQNPVDPIDLSTIHSAESALRNNDAPIPAENNFENLTAPEIQAHATP
jgi:hypothetical protein